MNHRITIGDLWHVRWPIVGMVHLLPLPGATGWRGSMADIIRRACEDARMLADGGIDGVLIENYGDVPFHPGAVPPETVAAMTAATVEVARIVAVPVGVNVLRNDAAAAVAIAVAAGADFVRVNVHTGAMLTDQGWIEGKAHDTLRLRTRLDSPVAVLADVLVKHATAPPGVDAAAAARDTWHRGLADGLIVTGGATGATPDPERLLTVRHAVPDAPLWIGSGLDAANAPDLLPLADAAIVGSALQHEGVAGSGVDSVRVKRLVRIVHALRDTAGRERS